MRLHGTDPSWTVVWQCNCKDPDNQGAPPPSTCKWDEYKGDGNCDDENNNKGCEYDGGDCCAKTVKDGKVNKDYCNEVSCKILPHYT